MRACEGVSQPLSTSMTGSHKESPCHLMDFPSQEAEDGYLESFPAGYGFCPEDHELIECYLLKMVKDEPLPATKIRDVDLYKHSPYDLTRKHKQLEANNWYFFTPRDRKYRKGSRPSRAAGEGYWKATGADTPIVSRSGDFTVGTKKTLVYYEGLPQKGVKSDQFNFVKGQHAFASKSTEEEGMCSGDELAYLQNELAQDREDSTEFI